MVLKSGLIRWIQGFKQVLGPSRDLFNLCGFMCMWNVWINGRFLCHQLLRVEFGFNKYCGCTHPAFSRDPLADPCANTTPSGFTAQVFILVAVFQHR